MQTTRVSEVARRRAGGIFPARALVEFPMSKSVFGHRFNTRKPKQPPTKTDPAEILFILYTSARSEAPEIVCFRPKREKKKLDNIKHGITPTCSVTQLHHRRRRPLNYYPPHWDRRTTRTEKHHVLCPARIASRQAFSAIAANAAKAWTLSKSVRAITIFQHKKRHQLSRRPTASLDARWH